MDHIRHVVGVAVFEVEHVLLVHLLRLEKVDRAAGERRVPSGAAVDVDASGRGAPNRLDPQLVEERVEFREGAPAVCAPVDSS